MTLLADLVSTSVTWIEMKEGLEVALGFSRDSIHVLAGPMIQLLATAILRTSLKSPWPWFVVLALALTNEWYDLSVETWPSIGEQLGEGMKDLLLTIFLPTLLLITARVCPALLTGTNEEKDTDRESN